MIKDLSELEKFLAENMMENYTESYIVHLFNGLMEKLVEEGNESDYVVSVKYIEAAECNMFAYAYNSEESGLVVGQTFNIDDAIEFYRFADHIESETGGNYNSLSFEEMEEYLSNLY